MAKAYRIKTAPGKASPIEKPKTGMTAPKKLMLLFTIVNRNKAEFYVDVLQKFEINMQLILAANGTADTTIQSLLGLTDLEKSVIVLISFSQPTSDRIIIKITNNDKIFFIMNYLRFVIYHSSYTARCKTA